MITRDGVTWLTAEEVASQFGDDIRPDRLRDWKRRGLIRGTLLNGAAHYRRDDVEEAEHRTRTSRPGRRRAADARQPADA